MNEIIWSSLLLSIFMTPFARSEAQLWILGSVAVTSGLLVLRATL